MARARSRLTRPARITSVPHDSECRPVKYYYSPKETVVVDSEGNTVDWKYVRADMPVKYTYVKEGDRMVVRKITLEKPVSYYEKTTTTTTTTKP